MGLDFIAHLSGTDTPGDDTVKEVVTDTINYAITAASIGVGMVIGIVVAALLIYLAGVFSRGHHVTRRFLRHARTPLFVAMALWFGHLGLTTMQAEGRLSDAARLGTIDHVLVIATIIATTWMLIAGAQTIEDVARRSARERDHQRASRMTTQAQMIRRIVQGAVLILGAAAIAMTFPAARTAIASVMASAGVASIVATLAAQSMLANIFAGFQIAMTDALRVGDIIVVSGLDGPKVQGTVEEITLTYVVVHVWDGRRIVIPSSKFTTNEFENLTRRQTEMMASVELLLDFRAPLTQIRAHVDKLLAETDLWDGNDANVQVTGASAETITVRIVVSASNSGNAWDLGCWLREGLLTWIAREAPYALPRSRYQHLDVEHIERDLSEEKVADLAEELANITGPGLGHGHSRIDSAPSEEAAALPTSVLPAGTEERGEDERTSDQREHRARLRAAKSRARRAIRRRSILTPPTTRDEVSADETAVLPASELPHPQAPTTHTTGDRLYSGSPRADERGRIFSGEATPSPKETPHEHS
ncbi:mechanosensitive ion channel [Nanchangia anserum]|uniref:Mechanosensitive ion channel n=1 Tax=Nanchangia anserum TaxID=2692125 RepID=A0A8I0KQ18_9ACTO|nr:mechanosensitive ion channel domain-containing protein [Nanchangia anserum]MBD3689495.1 mechanosensitive ion channel [Nanchangia anserum]QOX81684.1 mechanosensitive ion channel [Nanchangia anserum]